jgi:hypothetical protein
MAGARRALFCSAEDARRCGSDDYAEAEEGRRGGGSRVPSERRIRGGNAAAAVGTSVELLGIPGVGPRNLRKLVDNGFEGVAQLKQLYRDKVHLLVFRHLLVCVLQVGFRLLQGVGITLRHCYIGYNIASEKAYTC